jgi:hypothetical protein
MPYEIVTTADVHRFRLFGVFTARDMIDFMAAVEVEEGRFTSNLPRVIEVLDVTGVEVDFQLMLRSAQRRQKIVSNTLKSAIVAVTEVQFGFARMWQSLCADSKTIVEIFPTVADALAWIRAPGFESPAKRWPGPAVR